MIKKQFTLYLENKPGALAAVTKRLCEKKVSIEGISVSVTTDVGLVQMVPDNAKTARKVLGELGVPYTMQDVCLVTLRNEAGSLYEVISRLAASNININYVYATSCACSKECNCYAIISAPNLKTVEKVWTGAMKKR